jgi:hypothetical protein
VIRLKIEGGVREGMREVRKRGMRAVEIEAAEKCGQCRKVLFSPFGGPVCLQFCSESHVSTSVPSWPLNRSGPLVNRGWSAHRLNSLTLTPERMGGARRSSPPAGQTLTKHCVSRIARGISTIYCNPPFSRSSGCYTASIMT